MNLSNRIIVRSLELYESKGIKQVRMDDIAQEMGISKKTLYVHYKGKKTLVSKTIKYLFDIHFSFIDTILSADISNVNKIIKIYEYGIIHLIKVSPIFISDLKKYHSDSYHEYLQYRRKIVFGIVKNLLDEGQKKGEINQTINTKLFCEFHLISLDKIITNSILKIGCNAKDILDNTIQISLKGIIKKH